MLNKDGHNVLNLLSFNKQLWIITHNSIVQYHTDKGICTEHKVPNDYMTVRIFRDQTACLDATGTLYAVGTGVLCPSLHPKARNALPGNTFRQY